ncbi:hypothetical protein GWK47_014416 [Chionoecetes opilio]|uniref:Uncharacterized protein n=1 Tax=Chionoecetes opilio TaxID=41210 RepID=A0A8J5CNF1_CHIOP|nr:hypothetical protein GWK47_014416 [Chionoecetes opilio]
MFVQQQKGETGIVPNYLRVGLFVQALSEGKLTDSNLEESIIRYLTFQVQVGTLDAQSIDIDWKDSCPEWTPVGAGRLFRSAWLELLSCKCKRFAKLETDIYDQRIEVLEDVSVTRMLKPKQWDGCLRPIQMPKFVTVKARVKTKMILN